MFNSGDEWFISYYMYIGARHVFNLQQVTYSSQCVQISLEFF